MQLLRTKVLHTIAMPVSFIIIISLCSVAAAGINGIYALAGSRNPDSPWSFPPQVWNNVNVAGVALRYDWNALEPNPNSFNWSGLDTMLSIAEGYGKKVSLSVTAGISSPSWVYAAGAQRFEFVWSNTFGPPLCSVVSIPVPWDPIFQAKWRRFVAALGARYDSDSRLTLVKVTGLNSNTQEIDLPRSTLGTPINHGQCFTMADVHDWQHVGYTRTKVERAWLAIMNDFVIAFPNKKLAAMLVPWGFPPLDDNGHRLDPRMSEDPFVTTDILQDGISDYGPGIFVAQNNALRSHTIESTIANVAAEIETGYQTINALGLQLPAAMTLAISKGADYLELYPDDLTNPSLQDAIQQANAALLDN